MDLQMNMNKEVSIMATCKKCNAPVPEGARFCNSCGAPIDEQHSQAGVSEDTISMPAVRELPPLPNQQNPMQQPNYTSPGYNQPPAPQKSHKTLIIIVIVALLGAFYFYNNSKEEPPALPQQPSTQQPGTQQPGTQQPGTQQPGTQQPGTQQPSTQQPGTQQPGTQQPGLQPLPQQPSTQPSGGSQISDRKVIVNYMYELETQIQQLYQSAQNGGGQETAYQAGLLAQEIEEVGKQIQSSDPAGYNLLALDYQRLTCIFSIAMGQNVQQAYQMEMQLRQQLQQALTAYQQGLQ